MTFKMFAFAAALALPASALIAETPTPVGHGATAGRSPHQAYNAGTTATCGKVMHTIPAGKLPTYGTNAIPGANCDAPVLASADAKKERARD